MVLEEIIRKQKQQIERLEKENIRLKKELDRYKEITIICDRAAMNMMGDDKE